MMLLPTLFEFGHGFSLMNKQIAKASQKSVRTLLTYYGLNKKAVDLFIKAKTARPSFLSFFFSLKFAQNK